MEHTDLTTDERVFLYQQKIRLEHLFDARGMDDATWKEMAKKEGKLFVIGARCGSAGHRLRSRAGHCIQCDTARIAYMRRFAEPGYVYIAATKMGKLLKVGSCISIEQRQKNLQLQKYGNFNDWEIIAWTKTSSMGMIEFDIHKTLEGIVIEGEYFKDGRVQKTREMMQGDLRKVWQAYNTRTEKIESSKKWRHPGFVHFDFSNRKLTNRGVRSP
jgi:hypothetical protein